jgi:hypothetical protein
MIDAAPSQRLSINAARTQVGSQRMYAISHRLCVASAGGSQAEDFVEYVLEPQADPHGPNATRCTPLSGRVSYWQVGNLKDAIRVLQLKEPVVFRYWSTYQKVQSSTGSIVMAE